MPTAPTPENTSHTLTPDRQPFPAWMRRGLAIALAFMIVLFALFVWQPKRLFYLGEYRRADEVIAKVEAYRAEHGRLPESLEQMGFPDASEKVFYEKTGEGTYRVWFGMPSGESEVYDSNAKQWR